MQHWRSISETELEKLRARGAVTQNAQGQEGLRVTLQSTRQLGPAQTRQDWRGELECWARNVENQLQAWGGEVDAQTLSIAGQTVEAWLPIASLDPAAREMAAQNCRIDVLVSQHLSM